MKKTSNMPAIRLGPGPVPWWGKVRPPEGHVEVRQLMLRPGKPPYTAPVYVEPWQVRSIIEHADGATCLLTAFFVSYEATIRVVGTRSTLMQRLKLPGENA